VNTLDRIAEIQKQALLLRLLKGAEILGRLWRDGGRCADPWGNGCPCGPKASEFCAVKLKWIGFAVEHYDGHPFGLKGDEPYYVIEAMTVGQFQATGLTAVVEIPGFDRPLRVGPKGTVWKTISDLGAIEDEVERAIASDAVLRLQEAGL